MAYTDDVRSRDAGDRVEIYEFTGPQITYRYTSAAADVVYAGSPYSAAPGLTRTPRGATSGSNKRALTVTLSCAAQVVRDYAFGIPPRGLRLTVYEVQQRSGEGRVIWDGDVTGFDPKGESCEIRIAQMVTERLATEIPSVRFQAICNHVLYDARCRINRADKDYAASVVSVSGYTVTLGSIGLYADQWFKAGEIVRDADGERRTIVDQTGAVLTLHSPFRSLATSDAVTLYFGCDHSINTCSDKFNNISNFGGHPAVPSSNPFLMSAWLRKR